MEKMPKERIIFLSVIYISIFIIIVLQLVNLQIVKGEDFNDQSQRRLLREGRIPAARGNILDRNNVPIAVNRMGYSVSLVRSNLNNSDLNKMIDSLVKILVNNNDYYESSIRNFLTFSPLEYGPYIKDNQDAINRWKKEIVVKSKDAESLKTPKDVFKYLRNVKYKIDSKYSDEDAFKIIEIRNEMQINGVTSINPMYIARDVSRETVAQIEERNFEFPGVSTEIVPVRKYADASSEAHIIGYVGKINSEEYKQNRDFGYGLNDIIGKTGLEYYVESELRGLDGEKQVEVNTVGTLTNEITGKPAFPGNNIILTLNRKIQKVASESLEKNIQAIRNAKDGKKNFGDAYAGAVVAIDVNNGEILALANYPSYDPAIFIASSEDKELEKKKLEVLTSSSSPMLNRAISGTYAPGSTFKPLTAIAALQEGVITPETTVRDTGKVELGGWPFYCLEYRMGLGAHGDISLKRALATSCNIYFHVIGFNTKIDNISKWAEMFGLGEKTGVDLPGEAKGMRANRESKLRSIGEPWWPADTAQASIGQMNNAYTPIQLANYVAAIGNGGMLYKPHLIKKIVKYDGKLVKEIKPEFQKIPVDEKNIAAVKDGMIAVTNSIDGTAVQVFRDFPFQVAGKTGTPETGLESRGVSSNGVYIGYAPADKPQIAVAVVIERGVWGANAAPIARDVMKEYFGLNRKKVEDVILVSDLQAEWTR